MSCYRDIPFDTQHCAPMAQDSDLCSCLNKEMTTQESGLPALPGYEWTISSNCTKKSRRFAADAGLLWLACRTQCFAC